MFNNPWEPNNEAQRQWFAKWAHEQEVCKACEEKLDRKCFTADRMDKNICQNLRERVSPPDSLPEDEQQKIYIVLDKTITKFLASGLE